ncbi:DnaJ-domain-containing protein [Coccomyxa subellipsoidea C-169]|uniref:DnaJ-domain-containing protein n=1 Tax=Coccomyxa subellipsoidea (strain C-169) TaxID=574566 RepID=I0Z022_COCSC|nr:DnaJ-domain-containing protein [Coccomyxa subellipsoidea C-169]EIE23991.1 DnaJ-domain-containing protein [Coccomyxa subellipsoidea C-169]|eukprot:XP_005648535.1 DnaJ-domain-containing protein [Coccomyxa subellipsoidea C-169]
MKEYVAFACVTFIFSALQTECYNLRDEFNPFCGKSNCYQLLRLEQNASLQEVKKSYRNISLTLHPDKNPSKTAADDFGKVATAYEILSNSTLRADYDYALAHPKEYLLSQYRYYGSRIYREMKIPAHFTVTAVILLWSLIQYITKRQMYDNAMNKIRKDPKYRSRLRELMQEQSSFNSKNRKQPGKARKLNDMSAEEMEALNKQVDSEVTVQGGRSKPTMNDILVFQIVLLPWILGKMLWWQVQWTWKYRIKRQPYDEAAQIYLTRDFLRMSSTAWDALEAPEKQEMLDKELWIEEKQKAYQMHREKANQKLAKKSMKRMAQMVAAGMPVAGDD